MPKVKWVMSLSAESRTPPGETLWEQRCFIERDENLRRFVLNEPRGGVFRHVNLLVPPKHPDADIGWIITEPADTPPMSGSNSICVATVVLDTGIIPMTEPDCSLIMEAPGGLVKVHAACRNGKAERITITNVPSFVDRLDTRRLRSRALARSRSIRLTAETVL